jgi:hypothetical protein
MAEAHVLLATVLHRQGDRVRATALLNEAIAGAAEMGSLPTVRAAERTLAELGVS